MGVDSHEDLPDKIPTVDAGDTKRREYADARAETERADSERDSERTEDVGGDLLVGQC